MKGRILIIDDEQDILFSLRGILEDEGYIVLEAVSGEQGLVLAEKEKPDLVFLDIWLPGIDGMDVLQRLRSILPDLPVVMISGHGSIETAVSAIKNGAFDFIEKPLSLENILIKAEKALEFNLLKQENKDLRRRVREGHVQSLSGKSPAILELKKMIAQVAPTQAWVLITGENGTGKEIVARSIHYQSSRCDKSLIAVNCAAIPEELIESELFGHEKGAFTGAEKAKKGKFELADQGTLFLDEIGDMSLKTQAKILRLLQEQEFERVGGSKTMQVDVRVIAATNKELDQEILQGNFREDLYYRLKVFPVFVPALRQRKEDIPLLLDEFIARLSAEHNFRPLSFSSQAIQVLMNYDWPGNVRELKNFMERLFILYQGSEVSAEMLPSEIRGSKPGKDFKGLDSLSDDFKAARLQFEEWYLRLKYEENKGNVSKLAENIGMERSYIHRKLKGLGIGNEP